MPILGELIAGGLDYGATMLVEFEPHAIWYETSLTIAAQALRNGTRIEYHVFQHNPNEVRTDLHKRGLNVRALEENGFLMILDSYTPQTEWGGPLQRVHKRWENVKSLDLKEWGQTIAQQIREGFSEQEKGALHIDDNTSVLLEYNEEKALTDFCRLSMIPWARATEIAVLWGVTGGVATGALYSKLEALFDGIVDFKVEEENGRLEHYVRVRTMRGKSYDSRWHRLRLLADGEVKLAGERSFPGFKFRKDISAVLFEQLADAFIEDYMTRRFPLERAGWRSLGDLARKTQVPLRTLYGKKRGLGASVGELVQRGLVESRVFPGERGRGGEVIRLRIAYEKEPIKEHVNLRLRRPHQ